MPEVGEQAAAGRGAAAERVTDSSSNGSSAAEWVSDGSSNGSSVAERLAAQSLDALSSIVVHLPPGLLHRIAHLVGAGWYLVAPHQRKLARTNLRRVCGWLDANGMATPRVRAAAHDPRALERLLRDAFGHRARYYLEVAMNVRVDRAFLEQHLSFAEPALVERVLGQPGPAIVIGLHLGALEMPAQYITVVRGRRAVAPMETLRNRALQAYLERTRGRTGVEIIPARQARPALQRALARGDLVGLIADRTVGGPGVPVQLFGAPARLPAGPGVLAVETGVPAYAAAVTRTGWSTYRASVVPLAAPAAGSRHERARAFTDEMARAFERLIAQAPEQWWSIFQPIWD